MNLIPILAFVLAQDPEHRPEEIEQLRTKTAFTLRQDELEADAIVSFVRLDHARFEHLKDFDGDVTEAAVEVSWGVRDWLTAEVRVPALFLNPGPSGLGDASVDLKAALPKAWAPPYLAVGLRSTLPT